MTRPVQELETTKCPKCGTFTPLDRRFCPKCGQALYDKGKRITDIPQYSEQQRIVMAVERLANDVNTIKVIIVINLIGWIILTVMLYNMLNSY